MENYPTSMFVAIAPFILLIALWVALFVWFKQVRGKAKSNAYNHYIEPMREMLQHEIVPEIRALRESIDALRKEIGDRRQ